MGNRATAGSIRGTAPSPRAWRRTSRMWRSGKCYELCVAAQWDVSARISRNRQRSTRRLHKQATDEASPTPAPGANGTRAVYHSRVQHTREAPGPGTGARREPDAPHATLNCPIDRHEDARHVFFLVQERMLQVEEPAQHNTASLIHSSRAGEGQSHLVVLPLSVVDNSNFSPNRLTTFSTLLILASQGAFSSPHSKQRGFVWSFMCSWFCLWSVSSYSLWRCFGVLTCFLFGLPPHEEEPSVPRSNDTSSHEPQTIAPPVVSPPLPRRLEGQHQRYSRPWREVKSRRGAPKRVNTEGYACPNQKCLYFGIIEAHIHAAFWRWQAWPSRAHPDVSRSRLPLHLHCPTPHPLVPSENPFPADRSGALGADRRAGSFGCRAGLRLSTSHHYHLPVRASTRTPCTSASSAICASHICSWTNSEPGCEAPHKCSGCGWPSIPSPRFCLCFSSVPARSTWRIGSSTPCDRSWLPSCLPLFT